SSIEPSGIAHSANIKTSILNWAVKRRSTGSRRRPHKFQNKKVAIATPPGTSTRESKTHTHLFQPLLKRNLSSSLVLSASTDGKAEPSSEESASSALGPLNIC